MATPGGAGVTTDTARPSTSGNANAKKCVGCLEDFFDRLETTVKKRQRIKLGGAQSIDWTKLSTALGAATNKPKPPILPSSRTWRTDLAVEMKPEIKQQLREVFIRYCGWGDKQNFMFISRAQFIRFVRDMGMCNDEIDALGLSGLFDKILLGSLDPGAASRLALSDFLLAVTGLGTKLCPAVTVQESFDSVVSKYILPRLNQPLPDPEPIDLALLHMDIVTTLERLRPKLTVLWDTYLQQQQQSSSSHETPPTSQSGSLQSVQPTELNLSAFLRFASDFEITTIMLSRLQLIHAFKRSKFGVAADPIDSNVHTKIRLNFQEFSDCIARCAMLAFDYKPPPMLVPTMDFKDSYRTAAKQMWLRQASATGSRLGGDDDESEVEMPAAVPYTIGTEERQQYDETLSHAPSMRISHSAGAVGTSCGRDRLISRAVSIAQGRTPTQGTDNLEMMLVHAEPSTMPTDQNKPLHLQQFSCDWVGRVGLTLSETGKLRQRAHDPWVVAGLYHTRVDPIFEQRAAEMLAARVVREQHLEALHLHYQAERRQQQREATRQVAAQRQELELQSGQTLARVMGSSGASPSSGSAGPRKRPMVRAGSAPHARGGVDGAEEVGLSRVVGLEEVLGRTGGRTGAPAMNGPGATVGGRPKTLLEELMATLDVDSKLPHASIAGHGQIRFG
ncbi:hypothetical protein VOLCADRAFT_103712 [Volvox carteri f. nagariensis]|uniref:EF-hand domain-containing protein n=1 Tax=Volvox carteri f. nagariensis TaxID=3068 RepID=D8TN46_VOLCA|nr:uncharacterized protein VOLCADRAFT_103712 [Volvox carteri f. nagariensis]EFJ51076.1 hypothetical protein VOLCADRAFT_103712 [Volvox carteri f. nagariensis]|eukprot:XP_002948088.1 hypothetical protein VOLCADRAFT_103712 [Volvox carteri f. nagariensis]